MSFINATHLTFYTVCYLQPKSNDHFVTLTLDNQVPSEHMKSLATQLNESKAAFLHDMRRQLLQEVPLIQEEDIDIEHVVKRAIDVFDRERKEILLRTMDENK